MESRLTALIVRIGDKSASPLEANLQGLAEALEGDLAHHGPQITSMLFSCITQLPVKTPVYGTLVGLINAKNADFGREVVSKVGERLQQALHDRSALDVKLLTRFLAELVNAHVLPAADLVALFDLLLASAAELDDSLQHSDLEHYAYVVLITIPFVAATLLRDLPDELDRLLRTLQRYVDAHKCPINPLTLVYPDPEAQDYFESYLWRQLAELKEDGWRSGAILQPYVSFEDHLSTAPRHTLPTIALPPSSTEKGYGSLRGRVQTFRLFDAARTESPDMKAFDRFLLQDYIVDLLHFFGSDHKTCTKFLLTLPGNFNYHNLLIETIFGQLFLLPTPPCKLIYYAVVIGDLCKGSTAIPPVLGLAIDTLFERADMMDVECAERFCDWFSHHLSNFDFKWHWQKWAYVLKMNEEEPKRLAVREILERTMWLAYYERVARTLPEEFIELMPRRPAPFLKYADVAAEDHEAYASLLAKVRAKEKSEQLRPWLDSLTSISTERRLDLALHALLEAGCKSFSHLLNVLERYHALLRSLAGTVQARLAVTTAVGEFWKHSPQHIIITLEKLMTYRIVDAHSIVQWIFSHQVLPFFTQGYLWDILRNTIDKTVMRTEVMRKELKAVQPDQQPALAEASGASTTATAVDDVRLQQARESYQTALRDQNDLLLLVFQSFVVVLANHLANSRERDADPYDAWYRSAMGHFKEVARRYHREAKALGAPLADAFAQSSDPRITDVLTHLHQF